MTSPSRTPPTNCPGLRLGIGLTALTGLMRVGFLGSPIVVGAIADAGAVRLGDQAQRHRSTALRERTR
jgi:hypothetical protein